MSGETTRQPITAWNRDVFRATVLAYRKAMGEGLSDWEAMPYARDAYIAAGGDPAEDGAILQMVAAAARDHREWFWAPRRQFLDRQHRYLRSIGMWPPPMARQSWPKPPDDFE